MHDGDPFLLIDPVTEGQHVVDLSNRVVFWFGTIDQHADVILLKPRTNRSIDVIDSLDIITPQPHAVRLPVPIERRLATSIADQRIRIAAKIAHHRFHIGTGNAAFN